MSKSRSDAVILRTVSFASKTPCNFMLKVLVKRSQVVATAAVSAPGNCDSLYPPVLSNLGSRHFPSGSKMTLRRVVDFQFTSFSSCSEDGSNHFQAPLHSGPETLSPPCLDFQGKENLLS